MSVSDAVESMCWSEAEKLERFFDRLTACHVVIADSSRRRRQGNLFDVRIHVTVPGRTLDVDRTPPAHAEDESIQVAVHDAFERMRRQLQDHVRKIRGQVKRHDDGTPEGRVAKLFPRDDYGFIETSDGRDVYFHRNSVHEVDFDALEIGRHVRFVEERGDKGAQATSVRPLAG